MFDCTVLILTYGRRNDLLRSLDYWSSLGFPLIIADGSPTPSLLTDEIPPNTVYIHETIPPNARTKLMLNHIRTEFCVLIGDDEFHTLNGLITSLSFLRSNKAFFASIGQCWGFSVDSSNNLLGGPYYNFNPHSSSPIIGLRLHSYFSSYLPYLPYAVWRTNVFTSANTLTSSLQWGGENVCEWGNSLIGLMSGRLHVHNELQWLRRNDNPTIGTSVSMSEWYSSSLYQDFRSIFLDKLIQLFSSRYDSKFVKCSFDLALRSTSYCESSSSLRHKLGDKFKNFNRSYKSDLLSSIITSSYSFAENDIAYIKSFFS